MTQGLWTRSIFGLSAERQRRWRRRTLIAIAWLCIGAVVNVLVAWGCVWRAETVAMRPVTAWDRPAPGAWPIDTGWNWPSPGWSGRFSITGYTQACAKHISIVHDEWYELSTSDFRLGALGHSEAERRAYADRWRTLPEAEYPEIAVSNVRETKVWTTVHARHDGPPRRKWEQEITRYAQRVEAGWPFRGLESRWACVETSFGYMGIGVSSRVRADYGRSMLDLWESGVPADAVLPVSSAGLRGWVFPMAPRWPEFAAGTLVWAGVAYAAALAIGYVCATRGRRRSRLGLCVGCGYDWRGLGVCPECGMERGAAGDDRGAIGSER